MELEKKLREQTFTLEDFREQLQQVRSMGPLDQLLEMIPGMDAKALKNMDVDEKEFGRLEAIISSMTGKERTSPKLINSSRKKRIAKGSGTEIRDVNRLLKQFEQTRKMMKKLTGGGRKQRRMAKRFSKRVGGFPF